MQCPDGVITGTKNGLWVGFGVCVGPVACPKFQALAELVNTVITPLPLGRVLRLSTQGSGIACGAPVQSATSTPFLKICTLVTPPAGREDEAISKTRMRGSATLASGAVMFTCCPMKPNPVGGVPVTEVS